MSASGGGVRQGVRRFFKLAIRTDAQARADADEEIDSVIRARMEHLVARGYSHADAYAAAVQRLGSSPDDARAGVRRSAARRERRLRLRDRAESVAFDVRVALRQLARAPSAAGAIIATLALGIGAATAIFSAVEPILIRPLPYPNADRIMALFDVAVDGSPMPVTFGTYREIVARARSFDALAVFKGWQPALTGVGAPERIEAQRVSAAFFRVLGVAPAMGRDFIDDEDRPGAPDAVVISDALWRRRFGAAPDVLGRRVLLDNRPHTVVGVMPGAFENVLAPGAELWAPLQYNPSLPTNGPEWGHHLSMIGRLRPGVRGVDADRELERIARNGVPEFARPPWALLRGGVTRSSLQENVTRAVRPALRGTIAAVSLLLLVACLNVANILLARSVARRGELAVRAALGAGRGRIARQLLTESTVLAVFGGVMGALVALAGVRALVALAPSGLPRIGAVRVDGGAVLFAAATSAVVGLLVGLLPVLQQSWRDLSERLHGSTRRVSGGHKVPRRALVVGEVAIALVLLVSAGLLVRSLGRLLSVDPGFRPDAVLTMRVETTVGSSEDTTAWRRDVKSVLEHVQQVPGVSAVALTNQLPLADPRDEYGVHTGDASGDTRAQTGSALRYAITPGYFDALGIPLRKGRSLTVQDGPDAPLVAVVGESFAKQRFPGRDAIGQRLRVGPESSPSFEIVGVVGDVRQESLADRPAGAVYLPVAQMAQPTPTMSLVVRTARDPATLATAVRRAVWDVDADRPISRVATMRELVARSMVERRFVLILFVAFAASALALALVGLYGAMSGTVLERRRELGIRAALGATPRGLLALVFGEGIGFAVAGIVLGLAGAGAASRLLSTMLFEVSRGDAVTYVSSAGIVLLASAATCVLPALRAVRVSPSDVLKDE